MCVIIIVDKTKMRPSDEIINQCETTNRDGNGIAWIQDGFSHWRKGLKLGQIKTLCKTLPVPYMVHFRIGTVGSSDAELTHPFPCTARAELGMSGKTKQPVLMHNGHMSDWRATLMQTSIARGSLPKGEWSDSRVAAYLSYHIGVHALDLLTGGQRFSYTLPKKNTIMYVGDWQEKAGMIFSNLIWDRKPYISGVTNGRTYPHGTSSIQKWNPKTKKLEDVSSSDISDNIAPCGHVSCTLYGPCSLPNEGSWKGVRYVRGRRIPPLDADGGQNGADKSASPDSTKSNEGASNDAGDKTKVADDAAKDTKGEEEGEGTSASEAAHELAIIHKSIEPRVVIGSFSREAGFTSGVMSRDITRQDVDQLIDIMMAELPDNATARDKDDVFMEALMEVDMTEAEYEALPIASSVEVDV